MGNKGSSHNDHELLKSVNDIPEFVSRALHEEGFEHWPLVLELAEFLLALDSKDLTAHLFLARAQRHLGNEDGARITLKRFVDLISSGPVSAVEVEGLRPVAHRENALLGWPIDDNW